MRYAISKRARKRHYIQVLSFVAVLVSAMVIIGFISVQKWYKDNLRAPLTNAQATEIEFIIEDGDSVVEIADRLEELDLIRSARAFTWFVGHEADDNNLQAGIYSLSPALGTKEIVGILASGRVDTSLITVLPGLTLDDIEDSMVAQGFDRSEVVDALNASYGAKILKSKPKNATLEGYIYPESIIITSRSGPVDVLSQLFTAFDEQITPEIESGIKKQGLNMHEAITLASIVQKEIGDAEIQPTVAQVFLKRLREGQILGSDVTFFYAAEKLGVEPAINIDSPYNTRRYGGLPPGPISNFTIDALKAVAFPDNTDYLYFVAGDDGVTYFSKTEAEHEALVKKYCIELCRL